MIYTGALRVSKSSKNKNIRGDAMKNGARQAELHEVEKDLVSEITRVKDNIRAAMVIQARKGNEEAAWLAKHL